MVDRPTQPEPAYEYDWQNPNLKKFDFGRVMGRMFQGALYSAKNFWLPVLFILGIPVFLIGLWPMLLPDGAYDDILSGVGIEGIQDIFTPVLLIVGGLIYLIYLIVMTVLYIAIAHNVYGYFTQSPPSFKQSLQRGLSRFWVTIGASILFILGVMLGTVLFIIPGILLLLGWYLMVPIIALEDKGPVETLSHSWTMSKGSKRWILLFFVVIGVISAILSVIFSLIAMPFGNASSALLEGGTPIFWLLNSFGAALAQIVTLLLTIAGLTSIYYEIQFVKYGVVHDSLSAVFD